MKDILLKVTNLEVFYGDAQALWDISFYVNQEEIFSIIGANSAGKSTILKIHFRIDSSFFRSRRVPWITH